MAKKGQKRKREVNSDEEDDAQGNYTVEVILKARVAEDPEDPELPWQYWVKWAGYGHEDNSWEPEANLAACQRLLRSFWSAVDDADNDKDYFAGDVVEPPKAWIRQELAGFKEDFAEGKEEARKQKERADRRREERFAAEKAAKKKKKSLSSAAPSRSASTASARPSTSKSTMPASASTSAIPDTKQKIFLSGSESDSDEPLASIRKRKSSSTAANPRKAKVQRTDSQDKQSTSVSGPSKSKSSEPQKKGNKSGSPSAPPNPAALLFSTPSPRASPEVSSNPVQPISEKNQTVERPATKMPLPRKSSKVAAERPASKLPSASSSTTNKPVPPLPKRQRTGSSNVGVVASASSRAGKDNSSAPASKASTSKPSTPSIPPAEPLRKPSTPVVPNTPQPSGATPKPTPTATPTVPPSAIPPHMQRKAPPPPPPPQATNPPTPVPSTSSVSGLSTKQRVAQGALNLAPITKEAPVRKSNLSGLNFKKTNSTSSTTATSNAAGGEPTRIRKPPPPPPPPKSDPLFDAPADEDITFDMVASPVHMHDDEEHSILPQSLSRRPAQAELEAQADDLLKEIIPIRSPKPTELASTVMDPPPDPPNPRLSLSKKLPTIPKKWKWMGELLMDVGNKTDHPCDVVLDELFPTNFAGLRIDDVMASAKTIHLLSFHDLVDMSEFLKTCLLVDEANRTITDSHVARLGPGTAAKDAPAFKILARYMTKKNQISLVPVFDQGALVGHLFLFPPSMKILNDMFHLPPSMVANSMLLVALLRWKTYSEETRRPFGLLPHNMEPKIPSKLDWKKNMLKTRYQLALRILKFPAALHKWLTMSPRSYCVWDDHKSTGVRETGYLTAIMDQCKVTRVPFNANFRVVFVHVGALKTFHKMPLLAEHRAQTSGIRFYSFGTHETVHPSRWGIREIYPFGGVVTFTPSALCQDPWGVINKMKVIHKHPMWMCYISPSTLGMATKLATPNEDPLAAFDSGVFVFDLLLKAIDEGEVSLIRAPPLPPFPDPYKSQWLQDHLHNRPRDQRAILEYCLKVFSAQYANIPEDQWSATMETEISNDLHIMQKQPPIMDHCRRYVVITGNTTSITEDGSEWTQLQDFSFNDRFLET